MSLISAGRIQILGHSPSDAGEGLTLKERLQMARQKKAISKECVNFWKSTFRGPRSVLSRPVWAEIAQNIVKRRKKNRFLSPGSGFSGRVELPRRLSAGTEGLGNGRSSGCDDGQAARGCEIQLESDPKLLRDRIPHSSKRCALESHPKSEPKW